MSKGPGEVHQDIPEEVVIDNIEPGVNGQMELETRGGENGRSNEHEDGASEQVEEEYVEDNDGGGGENVDGNEDYDGASEHVLDEYMKHTIGGGKHHDRNEYDDLQDWGLPANYESLKQQEGFEQQSVWQCIKRPWQPNDKRSTTKQPSTKNYNGGFEEILLANDTKRKPKQQQQYR